MKTYPEVYPAGSHAFSVIAHEEFQRVCDQCESIDETGAQLYVKHVSAVTVEWPKEATEKDIRKLAGAAMKQTLEKAGLKPAE